MIHFWDSKVTAVLSLLSLLVMSTKQGATAVDESQPTISQLRLLAHRSGQLFKLCKFVFSKTDASIYVIPYAPTRRFFCGSNSIPEYELSQTIRYNDGTAYDSEPKLSLHESGQVHVTVQDSRIAPVYSAPLEALRGHHVASICFDRFDGRAQFTGKPRNRGAEQDLVIAIADEIESGRLALFVNAEEQEFKCGPCLFTFTLQRPTLKKPIYVGVKAIPQSPLGEPNRTGVTVVAGWNARDANSGSTPLEYVFLRGD